MIDRATVLQNIMQENHKINEPVYLRAIKGSNFIERLFIPASVSMDGNITVFTQYKRTFIGCTAGISDTTPCDVKSMGIITNIGDKLEYTIRTLLQDGFIRAHEPIIDFKIFCE